MTGHGLPARGGPTSLTWLPDATEGSLRWALGAAAPALASLPLAMNPFLPSSNPLWWSATAVVDESLVVKFAWSEARAARLWREGAILERLTRLEPALPLPEVVVVSTHPVLVATRLIPGVPLGGQWAWDLAGPEAVEVGGQVGTFLAQLHALDLAQLVDGLSIVEPSPQADTGELRRRFPSLVDRHRGALVQRWCEWVDVVLGEEPSPPVFVHGDLHGYNQVWNQGERRLAAVVDFEESGGCDAHFDLRYLPASARSMDLLFATIDAYEQRSGHRLAIERVMGWNVLTVLGDALWRTEAGVALPGGGDAASWVDDLRERLGIVGVG